MTLELISNAFDSHAKGNNKDAELLCRMILNSQDNSSHLLAIYLLGIIALEKNDIENALNYLKMVVDASPFYSAFHHNYGVALMRHDDQKSKYPP